MKEVVKQGRKEGCERMCKLKKIDGSIDAGEGLRGGGEREAEKLKKR